MTWRVTETGSSYDIHRGDVFGRIAPVRFVNQARSSVEGIFPALVGSGRRGTLASPHAVLVLKTWRSVQHSFFTFSPFLGGGKSHVFLKG